MSSRARERRHRSKGSIGSKVMLVILGLLTIVGLAVGGVAVWALDKIDSAPSIDTLKPASDGANTKVYDADGNSLGYVQSDILRTPVKLKEIPKGLQQATISIEDENFYDHNGVDLGAIARAALANFEAGQVEQGASTITQQLVRNLYIEDPEDTATRKLQEAAMAMQYEDEHTKTQILNEYLNTATYGTTDGRSAVGVEAASEVFFDKSVKELGLREEALLAGLPQAPTDYNPFTNPNGAIDRRDQVLDAMAGQGYITEAKAADVKATGLGLQRGYRYEQRDEQYFFDFVQDELIQKYGLQTVRQGGLRVYTSLDPTLQAAAQSAIAAHPTATAANALVSTDTQTGEILAMASSVTYDASQFNLAAQGERQPGSAFKPFVLTAAVDQGIDPDTTYYPAPDTITLTPPYSDPWTVSGGAGGSISLRQATANSVNTVFAQLGVDVGPENFDNMAHKLGVTSELDNYYAEALGGTTNCCTVLEMSNAYASIANGGVHHDPTAIRKVVFPNGDTDTPEDAEGNRVISDGVAYTVADVMEGTLDYGTAVGNDIPCTASGKTGTTTEMADAWFVGYTPDVATAVWTGHPNDRTPLPGYGAQLSAPIWHDYMLAYIDHTGNCNDYPAAEDPAVLSAFTSSQTASSSYSTTTDTTATDATTTDPAATTTRPSTGGVDADGDGYP
ncbi:MAG: penicillin-binding protein, partial [Solirubrobacterales bacterium]|nr:penicillin-binding protein [Solirubrobacterales bacterium]